MKGNNIVMKNAKEKGLALVLLTLTDCITIAATQYILMICKSKKIKREKNPNHLSIKKG